MITEELEISLWIVEDEEKMAELNERYRNVQGSTDVLSFPQLDYEELEALRSSCEEDSVLLFEEEESIPLGDIVISLPKVEKQANEYGHSTDRELYFLFLHGLLHLLGYDHVEEDEENTMKEKQKKILDELGIDR